MSVIIDATVVCCSSGSGHQLSIRPLYNMNRDGDGTHSKTVSGGSHTHFQRVVGKVQHPGEGLEDLL